MISNSEIVAKYLALKSVCLCSIKSLRIRIIMLQNWPSCQVWNVSTSIVRGWNSPSQGPKAFLNSYYQSTVNTMAKEIKIAIPKLRNIVVELNLNLNVISYLVCYIECYVWFFIFIIRIEISKMKISLRPNT